MSCKVCSGIRSVKTAISFVNFSQHPDDVVTISGSLHCAANQTGPSRSANFLYLNAALLSTTFPFHLQTVASGRAPLAACIGTHLAQSHRGSLDMPQCVSADVFHVFRVC